jgi:integrase
MMMFRHGLRVSEAVDLRRTDFDLDAAPARPFWVRRSKGSKTTTHTLEPDTAAFCSEPRSVLMPSMFSARSAAANCLSG